MESLNDNKPIRTGSIRAKLALVGLTGLAIGAGVVGPGGIASADEPELQAPAAENEAVIEEEVVEEDGSEFDPGASEVSIEDEEVFDEEIFEEEIFEEFEVCLAEAGVDELLGGDEAYVDEGELTEEELAVLDEAFAECEPILDELSDEAWFIEGCDDLVEEDLFHDDPFHDDLMHDDYFEDDPFHGDLMHDDHFEDDLFDDRADGGRESEAHDEAGQDA